MKFSREIKSQLWSILEKYDTDINYTKFCNSLSNLIQDRISADDFLTVFTTIPSLDYNDKIAINQSIGADIDACLFSI